MMAWKRVRVLWVVWMRELRKRARPVMPREKWVEEESSEECGRSARRGLERTRM